MSDLSPILAHDPHGRRIRAGTYVHVIPETGPAYHGWVMAVDSDVVQVRDKKGRPRMASLSTLKVSRVSGEARRRLNAQRDIHSQMIADISAWAKKPRRIG